MKNTLSCALASLLALMALGANAQDEPAATVPPLPAEAASTVESLQAELQALSARHDREIKELRAEMVEREAEAAVTQARELAENDRRVRIYGFADVGMMRTLAPEDAQMASMFTTPLSFYFGRLNLYFDSRPDPDFRFLAETRLSLYPHGTMAGVNTTSSGHQIVRTSTEVSDVSSPNASTTVSWGSIILERAALDWTRYPFFSVRVGLLLTPFGIYNVDHGTPTLISTTPPSYLGQGLVPERQVGIQIFGSHPVDRWELGYAATASNGQSDGVLDAGDGKAFGGRLFARRQGELQLLLGASALYQPYRRDREEFSLDGSTYTRTRVVERTMLALGLDQSLDYLGLRVRNELVFLRTEYTPGMRDAPLEGRGGLSPDNRLLNWSLIVAYRRWQLEPYFQSNAFFSSPGQWGATSVWAPGAGVNVYLRSNVILKALWTYVRFYGDEEAQAERMNFHSFNGILTWAF